MQFPRLVSEVNISMETNNEKPIQTERKNPLLEKVQIPGERFRLPSSGLFYEDDELDESVKDGEIFINPMTAMDELVLKSPDKLLSGESVVEVITRCLPEVRKPQQLLAKDVDYILMALRMVSYGPTVDITQAHDCDDAKEHSYSISIRPLLQRTKPIDPTAVKKYHLEISTGQVVKLNPPRYYSTMKLYQIFGLQEEEGANLEEMSISLLENVSEMIRSVDGHTDRNDIIEWLKTVRVGDVESISHKITELSDWGLDPTFNVECKDCGKEMTVSVPVNPIAFFI